MSSIFLTEGQDIQIGFLGAGNMAQAMVKGFVASGRIQPKQITMMAPSSRHLDVYRVMGCSTTNFHNTMFEKSLPSVLILAMKPSQLALIDPKELCQKINTLPKPFYVVSVLAGTKLSDIEAKFGKEATDIDLGDGVRFARIMPNVSCAVNSGVVGLYSRSKTTNDDLAGLFGVLGTCEVVADENQLDGIIGVTGSGIAYVLTMIQAMADGGVLCGLPRDLALRLAARTVEGAGKMCAAEGASPIEFRNSVCSPAGTTIAGLLALERGGFSVSVMQAIEAAKKRAEEMAKKN